MQVRNDINVHHIIVKNLFLTSEDHHSPELSEFPQGSKPSLFCNYLKCVLSAHINNTQQGKKHVNL